MDCICVISVMFCKMLKEKKNKKKQGILFFSYLTILKTFLVYGVNNTFTC